MKKVEESKGGKAASIKNENLNKQYEYAKEVISSWPIWKQEAFQCKN